MIRKVLNLGKNRQGLHFMSRATFFGDQKFDPSKDYYLTLGVSKDASETQIKQAFYKLAKIHHPDRNAGNDVKFKQINQAYEVLSNPKERKEYDSYRTFGNFTKGYGQNFQQGQYSYQDFKNPYENMTQEQQQLLRLRLRNLALRGALWGIGILFLWQILTRKPHPFYQVVNGELVPVNPSAQFMAAPYGAPGYGPEAGYGGNPGYYQGQQPMAGYYGQPAPAPFMQTQVAPANSITQAVAGGYTSPYNYNPASTNRQSYAG